MEKSIMSTKGQIIIPARLRKKYGLKRGQELVFIEEDSYIIIKPRKKWTDLCGSVKSERTMEEVNKIIEEMRKDDEEREKQIEEANKKMGSDE